MNLPYMAMLELWRRSAGRSNQEFWNLTPREYFQWVAPYLCNLLSMSRQELDELCIKFPD